MTGESFDKQAEAPLTREEWIEQTAEILLDDPRLDHEAALTAARWGCAWLDAFKERQTTAPPSSADEARAMIDETRWATQQVVPEVERYAAGMPTLKVTSAAKRAFVLAFEESERPLIDQLITPHLADEVAARLRG